MHMMDIFSGKNVVYENYEGMDSPIPQLKKNKLSFTFEYTSLRFPHHRNHISKVFSSVQKNTFEYLSYIYIKIIYNVYSKVFVFQ